jgi:hypothetical protein
MTWVLQVNKMPEVCLCPLCVEHRIFQEIISQLESQDRRWMEENLGRCGPDTVVWNED